MSKERSIEAGMEVRIDGKLVLEVTVDLSAETPAQAERLLVEMHRRAVAVVRQRLAEPVE